MTGPASLSGSDAPKLALALSGGGAAGLGHIPVLEAFDDMGVRPDAMSGTSIGALIGACYAAGMTGGDIRQHVLEIADAPGPAIRAFWNSHLGDGFNPFKAFDAISALDAVLPDTVPETFGDLQVPLQVLATDMLRREERVLSEGHLREALAASMSLPGVFRPATIGAAHFIDGGVTNNLPVDVFEPEFRVLASDVSTEQETGSLDSAAEPDLGALGTSIAAMQIMMQSLVRVRLAYRPPAGMITPGSWRYTVLDFRDVRAILAAAEHAREDTKRAIDAILADGATGGA